MRNQGVSIIPGPSGSIESANTSPSYFVPDWMKDEKALAMGSRIWEEVSAKLEQLDPGCMEAVVNF